MDYRTLFEWQPSYTCFVHEVFSLGQSALTDDKYEWVAASVLRKNMRDE